MRFTTQRVQGIRRPYLLFGSLIGLTIVFWIGIFFLRSSDLVSGKALVVRHKTSVVTSKVPTVGTPATKTPTVAQHSTAPIKVATGEFSTSPSWSQDFSSMADGPLNTAIWDYNLGNGAPDNPGWGNNEDEYYTDSTDNSRVSNGQLIIEAQQQTDSGFDYTSARIVSTPSLNFTYGKLDIVAKLPAGVGTWPALWLLPSGNKYALTTPAGEQDPNNWLRDGEIDMLEATGSIPGQITSSAQSYDYYPGHNERMGVTNVNDDTTTFHDYELQWTPTSLQFLVDGVVYHTVDKAPSDDSEIWPYNQPYYLILNIAMGGTEGGTESQQYPPDGIDNSSGPWQMDVKSIDYYPYTGQ